MSDYHEAVESYNWALDVMYKEPSLYRVEIGEILDSKGTIHYSKGEIEDALECYQEALISKQGDVSTFINSSANLSYPHLHHNLTLVKAW